MAIREILRVSLWEKDNVNPLMTGIRFAPGSAEHEDLGKQTVESSTEKDFCAIGLPMFSPSKPVTNLESKCSHCKAAFTTREEQVEHYRLDWHHCNLQRSVLGKGPLTEEQFLNNFSDDSSSSESAEENSDEEEEDEDKGALDGDEDYDEATDLVLGRQARLYFLNTDGLVISMYRAVLFGKKCPINGEPDAVQRALSVAGKQVWAVMLLGGGHFAAAIFNGNDLVVHKTFHNYTVRAKQGGGQSSKDNQSGTSHPKSGGSSLRRYNEQSQRQHIQELMESWKPDLARCKLIFYHAKHHNRSTLFSGKNAVLNSHDTRLRTIPFPTRKAKFNEVKRVYGLLSEICVHGSEEEFKSMIRETTEKENKPKPIVKKTKKKKEPNPSNSKNSRKPKSERKDSPVRFAVTSPEESEDDDEEIVLMTTTMTLGTGNLGGEMDECSAKHKKRKSSEKKKTPSPSKKDASKKKDNTQKTKVYDLLYTACRIGNIENLSVLLKKSSGQQSEGNAVSQDMIDIAESASLPKNVSQITFGAPHKTMLHIAAENNQNDTVWWLLDNGCDPSVSDRQGHLPFSASKNKDTRNNFRRFMAEHPEKYDYVKASIPSPLTPEEDEEQAALRAKRKKAKRQAQQEKQKKKLEEDNKRKKEEEEKARFLTLSDREKRALAAERRLLQKSEQAGAPAQALRRCFTCATDITAMVPFEYCEFKFCSTNCVREHRSKKS